MNETAELLAAIDAATDYSWDVHDEIDGDRYVMLTRDTNDAGQEVLTLQLQVVGQSILVSAEHAVEGGARIVGNPGPREVLDVIRSNAA